MSLKIDKWLAIYKCTYIYLEASKPRDAVLRGCESIFIFLTASQIFYICTLNQCICISKMHVSEG